MKTEKLNLLLNKVVEFHKPNSIYCKGFLYKDRLGYYIKVVEDAGTITSKDIIRLEDGDENFITQADKPKLMRVSLKSWHYRLVKYVLGDNAPTPKTMQNGCPYFWLLLLSILVVPFKFIGMGFYKILMFFPEMFYKFVEYSMDNWVDDIDDKHAFDLYQNYMYVDKKLPLTSRLYLKKKYNSSHVDNFDFFATYLEKKHGISKNDPKFNELRDKIYDDWAKWTKEQSALNREIRRERELLEAEKRRIARKKKEQWEQKITPIQNQLDKIFDSIVKVFTIKKDWSSLIRRTKQVVGGLVTIFLLGVTYIFVNIFAFVLMAIIDVMILHWVIVLIVLGCFVAAGLVYVLYWVITNWVQTLIDKYRRGKKVWYVEAPIYLIYIPIKYVVIAIATVLLYIIWKPVHFGGYKVLWLLFLFPVGKWIWKGLKKLWNAVLGSTGIFGEYFSASYTDYCPGIEWADTDEE